MKKTLLVIENDYSLDGADYVNNFMKTYDGEIIIMTSFGQRSNEEIFKNVSKCTDIAVQTCFVNGSDSQFEHMVKLLSKIKHPINIYIAYIGISHSNELYNYIVDNTTLVDLLSIEHHNIYSMAYNRYSSDDGTHIKLDFTSITRLVHKLRTKERVHLLYIEWYKNTAQSRPTGRKIEVIMCTAFGKAFNNLPIGQVVDELDCHELSTGKVSRGVWIMGNGEPIMLVNDGGIIEYKISTKLSIEEIFSEIVKTTDIELENLKRIEIEGLLNIIKTEELSPIIKANIICEETGIEKRYNRSKITKLLQDNLVD